MNAEKSKRTEELFNELAEFINDVGMPAVVLTEADGVPAVSLLTGLPDEVGKGHYVVCSFIDADDEDDDLSACCHLYYEISLNIDELDLFQLLQVINAMNAVIKIGHFVWQKRETGSRIFLRYSLLTATKEELDPEIICDCSQSILEYAMVMEEMITALASGIEIEQVLADYDLNLEV